jgi:DNA-binding response OmpR family regulator
MKHEFILLAGSDLNARSLGDLIMAAGYEFSIAGMQRDVLRLAQHLEVDVLLVEVEAADLQCCSALVGIKTLPLASRPRLVLLSRGAAGDRARGLDLGANDVLSAPWDPSELTGTAASAIAREARDRRARRTNENLGGGTRVRKHSIPGTRGHGENDTRRIFTRARAKDLCVYSVCVGPPSCGNVSVVFEARGQGDTPHLLRDCAT